MRIKSSGYVKRDVCVQKVERVRVRENLRVVGVKHAGAEVLDASHC